MTEIPECFRCKKYNKETDNCNKYTKIPKEILDGVKKCNELEKRR